MQKLTQRAISVRLKRKAAKQGSVDAQCNLAACLMKVEPGKYQQLRHQCQVHTPTHDVHCIFNPHLMCSMASIDVACTSALPYMTGEGCVKDPREVGPEIHLSKRHRMSCTYNFRFRSRLMTWRATSTRP